MAGGRRGQLHALLVLLALALGLAGCGGDTPTTPTGALATATALPAIASPTASPARSPIASAGRATGAGAATSPAAGTPTRATTGSTVAASTSATPRTAATRRATPPPALARPAYTGARLGADYATVIKALAPREPNPGLYAVGIVTDYAARTVDTDFLLLSADQKNLYSYRVSGPDRVAAERPGSPEVITADAKFTPYDLPPWQTDSTWGGHLDRAGTILVERGWASAGEIGRSTLLARTDVKADWQITFEAGRKRFTFEAGAGELAFIRADDPDRPAALPDVKVQPWGRYADKPLFARDFRTEPFGLTETTGVSAFGPEGYALGCKGRACAPYFAEPLPLKGGAGGDGVVEVEFVRKGGPIAARYGLVMRGGGPDVLLFGIDGDGHFVVTGTTPAGKTTQLAEGRPIALKTGDAVNTITAVVVGGAARFYINGVEVWQGPVAEKASGDIALFTTSPDLRVTVRYVRVHAARQP